MDKHTKEILEGIVRELEEDLNKEYLSREYRGICHSIDRIKHKIKYPDGIPEPEISDTEIKEVYYSNTGMSDLADFARTVMTNEEAGSVLDNISADPFTPKHQIEIIKGIKSNFPSYWESFMEQFNSSKS